LIVGYVFIAPRYQGLKHFRKRGVVIITMRGVIVAVVPMELINGLLEMLIRVTVPVLFAVIPIALIVGVDMAEVLINIVKTVLIAVVPTWFTVIIDVMMMLLTTVIPIYIMIIMIVIINMLLIAAVKVIVIAVIPIYLVIAVIDRMIIVIVVAVILLIAFVFAAAIVVLTLHVALVQLLTDPDRLIVPHVRRSLIGEEAPFRAAVGQFPVDEGVLRVFRYRFHVGVVVAVGDVRA